MPSPQIEAVFKGPATFVIRTERGWKTLTELPKHSWGWKDDFEFWPTPASARANLSAAAMAGLDPLDVSPFPPAMIVVPPSSASEERRLHSNAQFALSLPLSVIVSSYTESEDRGRCRQRHAFRSRRTVAVGARWPGSHQAALAAGLFKLVIKNGIVTRYTLRLEGILLSIAKTFTSTRSRARRWCMSARPRSRSPTTFAASSVREPRGTHGGVTSKKPALLAARAFCRNTFVYSRPPTAEYEPVDQQQDDRANDRRDEADGLTERIPTGRAADVTRHERAGDAEQRRDDEATGVIPRHQEFSDNTDQQTDHEHGDDFHNESFF